MVVEIQGDNVPHALEEALHQIQIYGIEEPSRNGPVLSFPQPTIVSIRRPWERVIIDESRNANPFFHLAEFVWMMAGSNDVRFVERFNPRMRDYADSGTDVHHGAYGHRWRHHFGTDQIVRVSNLLKKNPVTRRAVLGMWDPRCDLEEHNDIPCNTHIYFRVIDDRLDMTVCNRSNDLLWGCLGANAVHMTYLHELIAREAGFTQGMYRVMTNNLHLYRERPDFKRMLNAAPLRDEYVGLGKMRAFPLLQSSESLKDFLLDCENYVAGNWHFGTTWFHQVFIPAMKNFEARKTVAEIAAKDWEVACREWLAREGKPRKWTQLKLL